MSWKGAFAAILVIMLLGASCWATVCDVACSASQSQSECPICHSHSHVHHPMAMSEQHCVHMQGRESPMDHHASLVAATSTCTHSFCRQPDSQVEPTKSLHSSWVQWMVTDQALIDDQVVAQKRLVIEAPPPGIIPSLSPVSLALRI